MIFQHTDIMPYALNYINYSGKFMNYGNNVNVNGNRFAINFSNGVYHFIYDDDYLAFDGERVLGAFRWKEDRMLNHNIYSITNDPIQKSRSIIKSLYTIL